MSTDDTNNAAPLRECPNRECGSTDVEIMESWHEWYADYAWCECSDCHACGPRKRVSGNRTNSDLDIAKAEARRLWNLLPREGDKPKVGPATKSLIDDLASVVRESTPKPTVLYINSTPLGAVMSVPLLARAIKECGLEVPRG